MRTYEPGDVVRISNGGLGVVATFHGNPALRAWDYKLVGGEEKIAGHLLRPATETELLVRWLETSKASSDTLLAVKQFLSTEDYSAITRGLGDI